MSREIKFRAWNKEGGKYVYDAHISQDYFDEPEQLLPDFGEMIAAGEDWFVIEQYTGLKDKNDVEIYEGDIIRILVSEQYVIEYLEQYRAEPPVGVCKVTFERSSFIVHETDDYYFPIGQYQTKELEVIGNIHENPELLEGEK